MTSSLNRPLGGLTRFLALRPGDDGPLAGLLHPAVHRKREQKDEDVRRPRVKMGEAKALRHMMQMQQDEDVEVQDVEAVAGCTERDQRAHGEDAREETGAGEAKHDRCEDRRNETSDDEDVRRLRGKVIKEEPGGGESAEANDHAPARSQLQGLVQVAEHDSRKKGAEERHWRVLERRYPEAGAVTVGHVTQVVGVKVNVKRVWQHAKQPKRYEECEELGGTGGPALAIEPWKSEVENRFAGKRPCDSVAEGRDARQQRLQHERRENDAFEELRVWTCVPLCRDHRDRNDQREQINRGRALPTARP